MCRRVEKSDGCVFVHYTANPVPNFLARIDAGIGILLKSINCTDHIKINSTTPTTRF